MANITATAVKELRAATHAPIMECKNALVEADGNLALATEILQKKGQAKLTTLTVPTATDGAIVAEISADSQHGVLVELTCRTDLFAKSAMFSGLAKSIAQQALATETTDVAVLLSQIVQGKTLEQHIASVALAANESVNVRRIAQMKTQRTGVIVGYIHHGARLGVLVEVSNSTSTTKALREIAFEIALQITSMNPRYIRLSDIQPTEMEQQRSIISAQITQEDQNLLKEYEASCEKLRAQNNNLNDRTSVHLRRLEKTVNTIRRRKADKKLIDTKLARWISEIVLEAQISIKDPRLNVMQMISEFASEYGATRVERFIRFELGG